MLAANIYVESHAGFILDDAVYDFESVYYLELRYACVIIYLIPL